MSELTLDEVLALPELSDEYDGAVPVLTGANFSAVMEDGSTAMVSVARGGEQLFKISSVWSSRRTVTDIDVPSTSEFRRIYTAQQGAGE